MFGIPGPWVAYAVFAAAVIAATTWYVVTDLQRRRAEAADEADEAAYQLFAARDRAEYPTGLGAAELTYDPVAHALVRPVNKHMAALVVDPTMTVLDVETAIEHVAPGTGSLSGFAAAFADTTTTRTPTEQRLLELAWEPAHAEQAARYDRDFFATFDRVMAVELARFDQATVRVDQWAAYEHFDHEHECLHCQRAVKEHSDEYRLIMSQYDTGAYNVTDLRRLLAAR